VTNMHQRIENVGRHFYQLCCPKVLLASFLDVSCQLLSCRNVLLVLIGLVE